MFDHLLESSHRDDSNEWSNIGFGEDIMQVGLIEVHFTLLVWSSGSTFIKLQTGCYSPALYFFQEILQKFTSLTLSVREQHLCLCKQVGTRPAAE